MRRAFLLMSFYAVQQLLGDIESGRPKCLMTFLHHEPPELLLLAFCLFIYFGATFCDAQGYTDFALRNYFFRAPEDHIANALPAIYLSSPRPQLLL